MKLAILRHFKIWTGQTKPCTRSDRWRPILTLWSIFAVNIFPLKEGDFCAIRPWVFSDEQISELELFADY
jgi:hypothetical protein